MSWNNLSMKDRASYIRMGVESGITDLGTIREFYNKFAEGGNLNVNDNPEKRTYDHNKGVYYVEGQDAPNNLKYSLDEFTQEQINEIIELDKQGVTHIEIGKKFNIDRKTVTFILRRVGKYIQRGKGVEIDN